MRRGASFEAYLRNRGYPGGVAAEWAAHAVWATGYAAGRWGKVLFDATPAELQQLADTGLVDWEHVGPAVTAWFDWLGGTDGESLNPARAVQHASAVPRLRLVQGG